VDFKEKTAQRIDEITETLENNMKKNQKLQGHLQSMKENEGQLQMKSDRAY